PNTSEFALVVTSDAPGAPVGALAPPVAPIAPEPLVPVVSTPLKLTTVIAAAAHCDRLAVIVALVSAVGANARQTSAVPRCVLVRLTKAHESEPPVMVVTVVAAVSLFDASTNASSSSLPAVVENAPDTMFGPRADRPAVFVASMVMTEVLARVAVNATPLTLV